MKPGQVYITSGDKTSLLSRVVAWATGSWWTHAFLITGDNQAIEATHPKVQHLDVYARLAELTTHGQTYTVLDLPGITDAQRLMVVAAANKYLGRPYNNLMAVLFALFRVFYHVNPREPFCSTLITDAFMDGIGRHIFVENTSLTFAQYYRRSNLLAGLATPSEIIQFSILGWSLM